MAAADPDDRTDNRHWVCVAALAGAHGVRGEVRVKTFTDTPDALARFETLHKGACGPVCRLTLTRPIKGGMAGRIDGVTSREDAQALSGTRLYVPRTALPDDADEDEFYLADLVGLTALDLDGRPLGRVQGVPNYGAGDLIELRLDTPVKGFGRSPLIPFEARWVPEVAIDAGTLTVDLAGWLARQVDGSDPDAPAGGKAGG
ncbi:16S rRNA processing protein RimM [Rhodothalassium salexigens DSM 2132]|uniref:Ribosome maturation factor RimM n=1 Tax=Rhodothalassium salexigens DSM 2132 TaxID=1188247 RepID=A0A4R2PPX9_RHOSA|nr:ribosome maturation factor RimM [Rhodothalassium salexigens]MBB4211220.1 16S rRNA processing protein RimM [Rhodothalassium salexigens DSM 2132]MBK1637559.1 16S rRNA processing protein RimM [Rhodothalassium salexigens DSM 2132]TCP36125.1 16S rRNA processing protein RimM [Rhodothalassium salexigens DSM 2132]